MPDLTITEFLLARYREVYYDARAFVNDLGDAKHWEADEVGGTVRQVEPPVFGLSDVVAVSDTHLVAAHIANHDPATVLADIAAKRRIVEQVRDVAWCGSYAVRDFILGTLAAVYADHPDYREEWKL